MLNFINKWKDKITHYVDTRVDLLKLDFIERTAGILSYFIFTIICLLVALCIFLLLGVGLAEFFTNHTGSRTTGFFITAGIYVLFLVILGLARKYIVRLFLGIFIRVMTDDEDDIDEKETKP